MGLFDSIVGGIKSATSVVATAAKATGSAIKTAAVATGKAVGSTTNTVSEYFKGAQETVANYLAANDMNNANAIDIPLEWKKEALKSGPVNSFAYRMTISNLWLMKNPAAIISIGSVGKAGTSLTKLKGGGYLLDFAKKEAGALEQAGAKGIKNIAGFTTSLAKKAAGGSGLGGFFSGAAGTAAKIATTISLPAIALAQYLDYYNWNGPLQTTLKQKFPWLFPSSNTKPKTAGTPEIKKMTPAETKQLQQIIYEATGAMLTGEELRQAIKQKFGITVLEIAPTKGNLPGPLAAGGGVSFQQSVSNSTNKLQIKSTPNYMISSPDELEYAAKNEIAAFLQALPGRMSFDFLFKKSYKDSDGVTRKGSFAFMKIKVTTKTGGQSTLAEIPIGTIPPTLYNPGQISAPQVSTNIQAQLSGQVELASLPPSPERPKVVSSAAPAEYRPTIQRQRVLVKPGNFIAYIDKKGDYWNQDVGGELLFTSNDANAARQRGEITEVVGYNPSYFDDLQSTNPN